MARIGYLSTSAALAAAVAAGVVLLPGLAAAAPAADSAAAVQSLAADLPNAPAAPLQEFRTANNSGTFYTLNPAEAASAQAAFGFRPTGEAKGISLFTLPAPGTAALHRLRLKVNDRKLATYIVSVNPDEIRKLSSGDQARFVDEGVLGYVLTDHRPGTMELHRYARDNDWRLARADRKDLLAAGYHDDGVAGFVPQG